MSESRASDHAAGGLLSKRFGRLDRFDALMVLAITACFVAGAWLLATDDDSGAVVRPGPVARGSVATPAQAMLRLDAAREMLRANEIQEAERMVRDVLAAHPAEPAAHLLLAEAATRRLDTLGALRSYRTAVALNPDYADRKAPVFVGKQIGVLVRESLVQFQGRLDRNGADAEAKDGFRIAHELKRMLAGSCQ